MTAWIPVSERLPEAYTYCWVWSNDWPEDDNEPEIGIWENSGAGRIGGVQGHVWLGITHWQPIPVPEVPHE